MDYGADIFFINAHSVRTRSRQHRVGALKELPFDRLFVLSREAGVVVHRGPRWH